MQASSEDFGRGHDRRVRMRQRAAIVSLVVAIVLFGTKFLAWTMTGSAAILSDALESIVNIVAAGMAWFSVWFGSQPADENHPYGHGKIEDFSAGVEGSLIVLAAIGILWSAVPRFFDPVVLQSIDRGVLLVLGAAIANAVLGWYLIREGREQHSRALEADGRHVLTDVWTSGGAIVALGLVTITGQLWIDPLMACLIAGSILVSGGRLIRESVGRLMDEADDEALDRIAAHLERHRRPQWVDVHELRAWWSGDVLHVDLHLALPRFWSIEQSHAEATALERVVGEAAGRRSSVVVHVDPCRSPSCPTCGVEGCPVRAYALEGEPEWTRERVTRRVPPVTVADEAMGPGRTRDSRRGD